MEQEQSNSAGKKVLFLVLGVAAVGTAGYFGYQYYQKKKNQNNANSADFTTDDSSSNSSSNDSLPTPNQNNYTPPASSPVVNTDFPLQQGSRGAKVRALQRALIAKYGAKILPKYGADGDFGHEMETALQKVNLPTSMDESTYNVIVKGSNDSSSLALTLVHAANARDFNKVIDSLRQMNSTDDYSNVSSQFKLYRVNGVHQTLVNGLLRSFVPDNQKQQIRIEFLRMGLKYDGNKWALQGIEPKLIITTQPTIILTNQKRKVRVPAFMVLGIYRKQEKGVVLFENNHQFFMVGAAHIKPF